MRRRSLGKGLGELIPSGPIDNAKSLVEIPVSALYPNPMQPRADIDPDRLEELTLSIEVHGVLQPILVRRRGEDYEIIAGERRWRAAQRAGLSTVPCILQDVSDEESLQVALIENLQREDLNPLEAARGYRRLLNEFALTQEQLAGLLGKSRSAIANTLRLLDLPESVQREIHAGNLSEGHGRALLGLSGNTDMLLRLAARAQEEGLTVREVERAVREAVEGRQPEAKSEHAPKAVDPNLQDVQQRLQMIFATRVAIKPRPKGRGKIEIVYSDKEEFERLLELFEMLL